MPDPVMPEEMEEMVKATALLYARLIEHGFPENRAYDLVRDLFLSGITTAV